MAREHTVQEPAARLYQYLARLEPSISRTRVQRLIVEGRVRLNGSAARPGSRLRPGDRLTDSTGEWEVLARPFTTAGGKNAHARLRKVSQPELTDIRTWGAHEKVSVKRASAEEGKR